MQNKNLSNNVSGMVVCQNSALIFISTYRDIMKFARFKHCVVIKRKVIVVESNEVDDSNVI